VFALEMPGRVPALPGRITHVSPQFELTLGAAPGERVRYRASSHLDYALQGGERLLDANRWLLLPFGYNPRALQAGLDLRREPEPARRVEAVLRRFREQPFSYTLEPPLLGRHTVDEFLYQTRAGFCEHYAGAFVFLMRAAGVPARVVTGYQGGETNPLDGNMTVRQSDAHAWAEVWLARRGWVRVDPTAAVAPERVRRGLSAAVRMPPPFGIEALRGLELGRDGGNWFGQLRNALGAVNNGWNQWVLNYTPERQRSVVSSLKAGLTGWTFVALLTSACILLLLYGILVRRRAIDPIEALYSVLCKRLGQHGLARAADEGPTAYAVRVAAASQLAAPTRVAAAEFLRRYSAWRYAPVQADPRLAATLKSLLSQVR
jgi:transglutaminase-like putative cysteine protease